MKLLSLTLMLLLSSCTSTKESNESLTCGSRTANIQYRVQTSHSKTKRFAILLGGSPATNYFSERGSESKRLLDELLARGFNTIEIKYVDEKGFYGHCSRQGINAVTEHCASLYDMAVKQLGFDINDNEQQLVAIGWSIGAVQLQAMAFTKGKRIDNIALLGVLMGDVEKGCKSYLDGETDGYSWGAFHQLAREVTINGNGCYAPSEYDRSLNFENHPHYSKWKLGLFEGESLRAQYMYPPGNIDQAKYIKHQRDQANAQTQLFSYPNCGHEILQCTKGKVVDDILRFVNEK